jgi:K+-transporting ATPase KdpF subunit
LLDFPTGEVCPLQEDIALNAMHVVAAVLGLGLLAYLAIALLMPERFQ